MLKSASAAIRISEIRSRLNTINALADADVTEAIKTEETKLIAEQNTRETEYRDALASEDEARAHPTVDAETRERLELRSRARVGDVLAAFIDGAAVDGATAEYRAAMGLSGYEIPLDLFEPLAGRPVETRAVTEAPTDSPIAVSPVQPYVYSRTQAAYLGVDIVTVGPGAHAFPALTTGTPASPKAKGTDADATAAVVTASAKTAKRITGAFEVAYEDLAIFPQLEDALRRDIPLAVAHNVDVQIVNGSGTAPNLASLRSQITAANAETTTETYGTYAAKAGALIDGRYASELRDVRQLVGLKTYENAIGLVATSTAVSAEESLVRRTAGFRATSTDRIPAPSNTHIQTGLARLGMQPMSAAIAVWGGIRLIRDELSEAKAGKVIVTALQLASDLVLVHAGAFKGTSFKLA